VWITLITAGTGVYPQEAIDALQDAVDVAITVLNDQTSDQAEIDAATDALNNAIDLHNIYTHLFDLGIYTNIYACYLTPNACTGLYFSMNENGSPIGKITFSDTFDLMDANTLTYLQNLDSYLSMSLGSVALQAGTSVFNSQAHIEMYQITTEITADYILPYLVGGWNSLLGGVSPPNAIKNSPFGAGKKTFFIT